jgi:hypothetical protein
MKTIPSLVLGLAISVTVIAGLARPALATPGVVTTVVYAGAPNGLGDVVPGTEASFINFGIPSVSASGALAFKASLSINPSAILSDGTVQALVGDFAPGTGGALFASFTDPVINASGATAFEAGLKDLGISGTNNAAIFTNMGGSLQLVVQKGDPAPGIPGAVIGSLQDFAITSNTIFYKGNLVLGVGGITPADSACVWSWTVGGGSTLVLQNGQTLNGKQVVSFSALVPSAGSLGNGRSTQGSELVARTYLSNHTWSDYAFTPNGYSPLVVTGSFAPIATSGTVPPVFSGQYFGAPIVNGTGDTAFVATARARGLPPNHATAVFADVSGSLTSIFQIGTPTPAPGTGTMYGFDDPVYNIGDGVATIAFLSGTPSGNSRAIVFETSGTAVTVAQLSGTAPGTGGALFAGFQSLALPDNMAPVFLANLQLGMAGVNGTNNMGVWAVDSTGTLDLVVRTGAVIDGKTVTGIEALALTYASPDQSRSFNNNHELVYRASYSDGSQSINTATIP